MNTQAFGLERLGHLCLKAPRAALLLIASVTLVALFGVTKVEFDDDLRNLLRSEREVFEVYDRFTSAFPELENQVFLLIESQNIVDAGKLEALRGLHLDLQFVESVVAVTSIFTARRAPGEDGELDPVFPDDLPIGEALTSLVEEAREHPLLANKMLSAANDATLIIISLEPQLREFYELEAVLTEIDENVAFATRDVALSVVPTGAPVLRYELLQTIRADLHFLNGLGALISILVCILFFRRAVWVILASVAPLIGVIWTLGGFGLAGHDISAMSNILPTLVMVIGFSDALHMVNSIRRKLASGCEVREACKISVSEVGPACAITSVTTIIALLSLGLSESAAVRDFGISGAAAVFIAFIVVITLIPSMAVVMLDGSKAEARLVEPARFMLLARGACAAVWSGVSVRPGIITLASIAVLAVTGFGYFNLVPTYSYREYLAPGSPANLALERINEKLGGSEIVFALVERNVSDQSEGPDHLSVVRSVHEAVQSVQNVENVISLASAETWLQHSPASDDPDVEDALSRMPDKFSARFVSSDGNAWLVSAYVPAAPAPETELLLQDIESALQPVRADATGYQVSLTGVAALAATESGRLIEGLRNSLSVAILVIVCVIGVTVRKPLLALFSAIPNLLSLSIVAAALAVLGAGFQFTSAIALTVAFGIAVDNTVHFIHRYRLERQNTSVDVALGETMLKVGPVLVAATAVLAMGMLVTQFSVLPMVVLFGRLCIVILCTALLATVIVLPAVMLTTGKRWRQI